MGVRGELLDRPIHRVGAAPVGRPERRLPDHSPPRNRGRPLVPLRRPRRPGRGPRLPRVVRASEVRIAPSLPRRSRRNPLEPRSGGLRHLRASRPPALLVHFPMAFGRSRREARRERESPRGASEAGNRAEPQGHHGNSTSHHDATLLAARLLQRACPERSRRKISGSVADREARGETLYPIG
jgi:hypothetical protein